MTKPTAEASDPLDELNPQQREAATYGVTPGAAPASALLVIAGAGSGKTSTLAHRVAHLIRHGADPQRLLLLTFSRRAAQEMDRRVAGVLRRVMKLDGAAPSLPWAGTFHSIGARLLRDCATRIGLSEAFTVHDRGDAEDLMGMLRHELGLTATQNRFPLKGTCLSIYSRVINSQEPWAMCWRALSPGAPNGRTSSSVCSRPICGPSRISRSWTTTTCCFIGPK